MRYIKANSLVTVASSRMLSVSGSPTLVRPPLRLPAPPGLFGGCECHDLEVFRYNIVPAVPSRRVSDHVGVVRVYNNRFGVRLAGHHGGRAGNNLLLVSCHLSSRSKAQVP